MWLSAFFVAETSAAGAMKVRMSLMHAGASAPVDIDIIVHPEWAPLGAKRFMELIECKVKHCRMNGCNDYLMLRVSTKRRESQKTNLWD